MDAIGVDVLGFISDEIGTHSGRASLAMMMYLAKEQIYTIMLVGRWNSDAFLAYIEKQVRETTKGVSARMTQDAPTRHLLQYPICLHHRGYHKKQQEKISSSQPNLFWHGTGWLPSPPAPRTELATLHLFLGIWSLASLDAKR